MPAGVTLTRSLNAEQRVRLPANTELPEPQREGDTLAYTFPVKCEVRTKPVNPWDLGKVVGISVMGICLWGTLIGSMLPLVFKWQGIDPGLASSPFVATAVDVTGIAIFFSIASVWLL